MLTFTESAGKTTIYVISSMIASFTGNQNGGTTIALSGAAAINVDQTPAQVLAAIQAL